VREVILIHEGKYTMSGDGDGRVYILNVENGAVKMCSHYPFSIDFSSA